ncbi:MgtC/SapB family protein [Microvirgula aerodenitrificans]|uniref:MgtC/SapB family protein n=1 Tax=Microvirgula aerodenitrificans TaxID=57480 RepID=UPI002F3F8542
MEIPLLSAQTGDLALRLLAALFAGAIIGVERHYHGRPAGFRTHGLVCLSSCLLMLMTVYPADWVPAGMQAHLQMDPTRMAQGIMTGIGFLGAGTILREGFSIRGLTTAASIWATAAIGVLIGIGFVWPAALSTVLAIGTLSVFRWVEKRMPALFYAHLTLRFSLREVMSEPELASLLAGQGFTLTGLSYKYDADDDYFEYRMVIRASHADAGSRLSDHLRGLGQLKGFRIAPSGEA